MLELIQRDSHDPAWERTLMQDVNHMLAGKGAEAGYQTLGATCIQNDTKRQ